MLDVIVDAFGHHSAQKDLQKAMHTSDPKKRDELLFHSLLNFLQGSDKEGVQQALKAGADVNRKTQNGVTPLKIAENFEIALILLKANADIMDLDANRNLPPEVKLELRKTYQEYLKANGLAQNKEPLKVSEKEKAMLAFDEVPDIITYKTLELLAKKSMKKAATEPDLKKRQDMLQKALVYSMEISDLEGMEKAIQAGADVKLKNKDGYNPLMLAPSPKTALFVLEHGGNLDDLDFAFRLKPTHKMAVRKAIEKRLQEKSLLTLLKRDSREI